ncbi:MAG: preprotein translocase subunit YajC [Terrimicrobiaceae bacterium]|nr:preprotein translocase subunit YajC [Terrimicrobiaceae bacterium]
MHLIDLALIAQAAATPAPAGPAPSPFTQFVPLIFIFVIFYFLLIRPQQKRTKEHAQLVASIQSGDAVVTSAGIHGVVTNVKEKTVLVRVADNVKLEFDRASITAVTREPGKSA